MRLKCGKVQRLRSVLCSRIKRRRVSTNDQSISPFSPSGSHNAVTYCLDMNDRSPVDPMQPDMLQKLDKYMKPLIRPFVYKWAKTQVIKLGRSAPWKRCVTAPALRILCVGVCFQEFTIKHQLDCGVRYCDLRIAHRPNDHSTDLYFYHGVYTTLTVEVTSRGAQTLVLVRKHTPRVINHRQRAEVC